MKRWKKVCKIKHAQLKSMEQQQKQGCRLRPYHILLPVGIILTLGAIASFVSFVPVKQKYSGSDSETIEKKSNALLGLSFTGVILLCGGFALIVFSSIEWCEVKDKQKKQQQQITSSASTAQETEMSTRSGSSFNTKDEIKDEDKEAPTKSDFAEQQYTPAGTNTTDGANPPVQECTKADYTVDMPPEKCSFSEEKK